MLYYLVASATEEAAGKVALRTRLVDKAVQYAVDRCGQGERILVSVAGDAKHAFIYQQTPVLKDEAVQAVRARLLRMKASLTENFRAVHAR